MQNNFIPLKIVKWTLKIRQLPFSNFILFKFQINSNQIQLVFNQMNFHQYSINLCSRIIKSNNLHMVSNNREGSMGPKPKRLVKGVSRRMWTYEESIWA